MLSGSMRGLFLLVAVTAMILSIQALNAEAEDEEEPIITNLYFYGDLPGNNGVLSPELPSNTSSQSAPCPKTGVIPGLMLLVGMAYTEPLNTELEIGGSYSFELWATGSGRGVQFSVDMYYNDQEVIRCFSDTQNVNGDTLFRGKGSFGKMKLNPGDQLEVRIYYSVNSVILQNSVEVLYGSAEHNSHISIEGKPITINLTEPILTDNELEVTGLVFDAWGSKDIASYELRITGPVTAQAISEPKIAESENGTVLTWTWNFREDKAKSGDYNIIMIVIDNSGNELETSMIYSFEVPKTVKTEKSAFAMPSLGIAFVVLSLTLASILIWRRKG